jgi:hypothetical protein
MGRQKYNTDEERAAAKVERRRLRKLRREGKLGKGEIPSDSPLAQFRTVMTTTSLVPDNQEDEKDILKKKFRLYHTTVSESMALNHMTMLTRKRCEVKVRKEVEKGEGQFNMVTFVRTFLYTNCPIEPTREAIDWVRQKGLPVKVLSCESKIAEGSAKVCSKTDSESRSSVTRKSCSRSKPGSRRHKSKRN